MSKVHAPKTCFAPIREDATTTIVSYELQADGNENAYWQEVSIWKTKRQKPSLQEVKDAVLADINRQTKEKIVSGFVWNGMPVWLSDENQRNFSEMQRLGITGRKEKIGEDHEGKPVYHTFDTTEELDDFYIKAEAYIHACLAEGRDRKDAIDWTPYATYYPQTENQTDNK